MHVLVYKLGNIVKKTNTHKHTFLSSNKITLKKNLNTYSVKAFFVLSILKQRVLVYVLYLRDRDTAPKNGFIMMEKLL